MRITAKRVAAAVTALLGLATLAAPSASADTITFPFDAELGAPLGFRAQPSLDGSVPFALDGHHYLQPGTRVHVLRATPGALWAPGTFCEIDYEGHRGFIRCNDPAEVKRAPAPSHATVGGQCGGTIKPGVGVRFCNGHDYDDCLRACHCGCDLDLHEWKATCPRFPRTGEGMLPGSSPLLHDLRSEAHFTNLTFEEDRTEKATQEVLDGLKRLDGIVGNASWKGQYRVVVKNCWRDAMPDTESECGFVLKAEHILASPNATPQMIRDANFEKDPYHKGLSSPGATPHSAGFACDIYMADRATGRALFDYKAEDTPRVRAASRALDEAITDAGGVRLTYEAWHVQFGGPTGATCTFPGCDRYWPPRGDDPGH